MYINLRPILRLEESIDLRKVCDGLARCYLKKRLQRCFFNLICLQLSVILSLWLICFVKLCFIFKLKILKMLFIGFTRRGWKTWVRRSARKTRSPGTSREPRICWKCGITRELSFTSSM